MERVWHHLPEPLVRLHSGVNVKGFERNLDEVEVEVFEDADLPETCLNHVVNNGVLAFGCFAHLGQHIHAVRVAGEAARYADAANRRQAAEVDADAYGHLPSLRFQYNRLNFFTVADIAGVKAKAVHAAFQGFQSQLVMEVDVGDKWDVYLPFDIGERLCRFHVWHGTAYYLAACFLDFADLPHGGSDITRVSLCHRLNGNGRVTANLDLAYIDRLSYTSLLHSLSPLPLR